MTRRRVLAFQACLSLAVLSGSFLIAATGGLSPGAGEAVVLSGIESETILGTGCLANGSAGTDCIPSLNNVCSTTPNPGGNACPTSLYCVQEGSTSFCKRLGARGTTYLCDQAQQGYNCTATCNGECYSYYWGPWHPQLQCTGVSGGCENGAQCGAPACAATGGVVP